MLPFLGYALLGICSISAHDPQNKNDMKIALTSPPVFHVVSKAQFSFGGWIGDRIKANERNWLLTAPLSNPAMTEMFFDRDREPHRDLLPWSGEFAGKYLTSAVECYRLTRNKDLKKTIQATVDRLIASQGGDGYLGPFPKDRRMVGRDTWDLWGQYHCMLGLYLWYKEVGDMSAFAAYKSCADYFCRYFLDGNKRVIDAASEEMNESCIHIFTLLYQETGNNRYLQLCKEIEKDFETPPSGDYIRASLAGKAFYQLPKPRWEGLHAIQGIAELYAITGDLKYRKAYEQIWKTIQQYDRHNTGGFSSGEQAQGNPYDPRPIETCCTIAWMALSVDMLKMTGDSLVADELELSFYNGILGAMEPNGRWWTYNTPMDGERKAATQDIDFQERPGSPELSCCSVNAPRGIGMLSEWAYMASENGVVVNYYGPSSVSLSLPNGPIVKVIQITDYPKTGSIKLKLDLTKPAEFEMRLRLPSWSTHAKCSVNGSAVSGVSTGHYLDIKRHWKFGDTIDLELDMGPWLWAGEKECNGKASLYWGPILLAYDPRFDSYAPTNLPTIDLSLPYVSANPSTQFPSPFLLKTFRTIDGKSVTLCDFSSAGMAGNRYVSWLRAEPLPKSALYDKRNPWRKAGWK